MKAHLKAIFCSYSDVFFVGGTIPGLLIFVATFVHPQVTLAGVIAVLSAYGFARLLKMDKQFLESGFYTYNPLLVGLSLGYLFKLTPVTLFFIISAGILTFLVTVFLATVFMTYFRLPILSLPFVTISSAAYLASARYAGLPVRLHADGALLTTDFGLPFWITGFLKAFGAVLFTPSVLVGLVLSIVMLCHSRILFLLALAGYYIGSTIRAFMVGSAVMAFTDINNFNFILIAMAIGGVFMIPSLTSYLIAAIAVAISTVFTDAINGFWYYYGMPVFTLPFNLVTLGIIYALGLVRHPMLAEAVDRTPEENLENHLANRLRYTGKSCTLFLPFAGRWTVWQGWDGQWTHKGIWRYAYDFVITDEHGETHRGEGARLEDYHAWKKPVLAPVRGRVTQVVEDLPDCPIGETDDTNKWGNLVIIEEPRGFFVELSHFAEKSIRVRKGDWVERGTVLGLCGNSGYSPQPHIHLQAQAIDVVGAASIPFSFVSYTEDYVFHSNDLPGRDKKVEPLYRDKNLDSITNFTLDDEFCHRVFRNGREIGRLDVKVMMAPDGTFYFQSSRGCLYFGKHESTFYFYRITGKDPWLKLMFLAMPRFPLAYRDNLRWSDYVPASLATGRFTAAAIGFASSFHPGLARTRVNLRFSAERRLCSEVESALPGRHQTAEVDFDRQRGFASIRLGCLEIRRVECNTLPVADA